MPSFGQELQQSLDELKDAGQLREVVSFDARCIDFVTNDYLCLSRHPVVAAAAASATLQYGAGARASRLLGGDLPPHRAAEAAAARWLVVEACLLFPSGTQANFGLLRALVRPGDLIFSDAENHASLIDGMALTKGRRIIYQNLAGLEQALAEHAAAPRSGAGAPRRLIVTDAIFSISGRVAPIARICELARRHDAQVIVDEAHAAGILGPEGAGLCAGEGVAGDVLARVVTGGKAPGVAGAFVAGSRVVVDSIINYGRAFMFTTATPPSTAAALGAAIGILRGSDAARARCLGLSLQLRTALRARRISVENYRSPIVWIPLRESQEALRVAGSLRTAGFEVRAVRPPTVPAGGSGIRISIHSDHTEEQINQLADALSAAVENRSVAPARREAAPENRRGICILGTDTGVGKTVISAAATLALAAAGPVVYWKPVQTGTGADDDTETLRGIASRSGIQHITIGKPVYAFDPPVAPELAAARAGTAIAMDAIMQEARRLCVEHRGPFVVECAGGLCVPYNSTQSQEDFIALLPRVMDVRCILVARTSLGTINHTRLTVAVLASRGISIGALVLCGEEHPENVETLRRYASPAPVLWFPRVESIQPSTLEAASRASGLGAVIQQLCGVHA